MIKIDEEDFELMVTIARNISFCRNTVVVGSELMHPSRTTKKPVFSVVFGRKKWHYSFSAVLIVSL
jgi:hypothetical protein